MSLLSHPLVRNLLFIGVFVGLVLFGVLQWLKFYTHHGERLVLPDYVDKPLVVSADHARQNSFEIVVKDSVFIVGKAGGIIQSQSPAPGFEVKRGRKVYVVVTKSSADMVSLGNLPRMYGERFDIKSKELERGFEIKSRIVDYIYDPGLPDMIMEVKHDGKVIADKEGREDNYSIPKGGTLDFVLSKKSGGNFPLPDLTCNTYEQAKFLIDQMKFVLGDRTTDGTVQDLDKAIVYRQEPAYQDGKVLPQGDTIHIFLTGTPPKGCN